MNTFTRMAAVAMTMWLCLAVGSANAGVLTMSAWDGSANTGYNATFSNTGVSSPFDNWISFSLPADSSGNGSANVISLSNVNNVIFTAFNLYENAVKIATGLVGGTTSFLSFNGGATPGNYQLEVAGFKMAPRLSGSYAGNISIAPVPEPEIYAMLLAGLGLIGFSARRRTNNNI